MEFTSAAILITEDCNARCKMCCDFRGLVRGKTVSDEEITLILNEIKSTPSIVHIGLTGGEPLLYPKIITKIIEFDFSRNVTITIKSNGFWGRNIKKAENFISTYAKKIENIH